MALRLLALLPALLVPGLAPAPAAPAASEEGRAALDRSRAAYREAGAFREILEATMELPNGRKEGRTLEWGAGPGEGAFLTLGSAADKVTFRIVAHDGRMVGTQLDVAGRYAEVPYQGDFAAALLDMGGAQAQIGPPPAVVARLGGDLAAFLDALRLGVLAPLEVVGVRPVAADGDGAPLQEVELRAANGTVTVALDAGTHRLREIHVALGVGKQQVRFSGRYTFIPGDPGEALAWPDLAGRTAVRTFAELEAADYPLGQPAPEMSARSLHGGTVSLADLRGQVVVLDFWATWCVPCWTALEHTSKLAEWAKTSGLPVKVFAVDTLETVGGSEEQARLVTEFLASRKLDVPVLLDSGKTVFSAFHNPGLPSLVIVGRDGKLARYHSGLLEDMVNVVRGEVVELASPSSSAPPSP